MKLYDRAFNSQFTRRRRKNRIETFWRDSNTITAGVKNFPRPLIRLLKWLVFTKNISENITTLFKISKWKTHLWSELLNFAVF